MEGGLPDSTIKRVELFSTTKCATAAQGTIIKNLCGLVPEIKKVSVTIPVRYSDYTDILASTITLLIWPSMSPAGAPDIVYP